MSTRGVCGFHVNGQDYLAYNHSDSYPSYLGVQIAQQAKQLLKRPLPELKAAVASLRRVTEADQPNAADIAHCARYINLNVSGQSEQDWYCLLRETQGDLPAILDVGILLDAGDFIMGSLMCEWGYILNLDDMVLEVYQGFQTTSDPTNRFGCVGQKAYAGGSTYYPCKLVATLPLDAKLPTAFTKWHKKFAADV